MNAPLRRVGVVVLVLFGLLFVNLNWVQAYKAEEYRTTTTTGGCRSPSTSASAASSRPSTGYRSRRAWPPPTS